MPQFDDYANFYDLFYSGKDYRSEAEFVSARLSATLAEGRRLLELGCGTGRHSVELVDLGWRVSALDLSSAMLQHASERARDAQMQDRLTFAVGDIRFLSETNQYDAAVSLFNVVGYLPTDDDLRKAMSGVKQALRPGGVFLFDFWFADAVLVSPPVVRSNTWDTPRIEVTRQSQPTPDPANRIIHIDYSITARDKASDAKQVFRERHSVRYFSIGEVQDLLEQCGFELLNISGGLSERPVSTDNWAACVMARA